MHSASAFLCRLHDVLAKAFACGKVPPYGSPIARDSVRLPHSPSNKPTTWRPLMRSARLALCLLLLPLAGCTTEAELIREGLLPVPDAGVEIFGTKVPKTTTAKAIIDDIRQRFQVEPSPLIVQAVGGKRKPVLPVAEATDATVDTRGKVAVDFGGHDKSARVDLSENAADGFDLSREADGFSINAKLDGAKTSLAEEADGYLVFRNAHDIGSALVHRVTPTGTEDYLLIESAPAVSKVTYQVHLGQWSGVYASSAERSISRIAVASHA
jgi:hypothetical protein